MADKENTYWKNVLTIVPIVGAGVATATYLLRLYSRRMTASGVYLEDIFMGIGLIISYCATAFVVETAFNGVGVPIKTLPPDERYRIQFGSWMIQKFWAPSMAFVKISIIVFLKRLLGSVRVYATISNCLIAFIALWALSAVLVNTFQCIPVQYYYDKTLKGHCMKGQVQFFQAMGSIALIEDVFILCLPIPIVWRLQITFRQKMALTLVFPSVDCTCLLLWPNLTDHPRVCIFSLLRLIEFRHFVLTDLASSSAKESVWTCLELNVAIICGCLPLLKPLFQGFLGKVKSGVSKGYSQPSTGSKLPFPGSRATNDGFQQIDDPNATLVSSASKTVNATAAPSHNSSDVELQGITVQTVIRQDVDGGSDRIRIRC
ncbi:hypothetical protein CDV55_106226 [Aspergillus turcosus]|uniref:Rhodopsin domain-containing protein n=1 Tax=Aspergillus turcosus TaxID=1245748 RepID=A0A229X6W9_9EURO|nr:hypothetical protein CDV55_106226 [Aspergillus turcosus]RLL95666.1 hypothetical protein CFD26_105487 [Aspergillus turcosus]